MIKLNTRHKTYIIVLIVLLLIGSGNLFAYQLSPLSANYSPSGLDSTKAYTITNDSDSPIAIEMKVYKRFVDKQGEEYTEEAPEYFSIQPSKMIIRPQSTQIVRVQYRGPRTLTKEMSFRIVSEQIAYSQGATVQAGNQMINFLFVYSTSAYVSPTKVIESVSGVAHIEDGKLVIEVSNTGSVHQILNDLSIRVSNGNNSYTLTEAELEGITGVNLLTDSSVEIIIDCPSGFDTSSSLNVSVDYNYNY